MIFIGYKLLDLFFYFFLIKILKLLLYISPLPRLIDDEYDGYKEFVVNFIGRKLYEWLFFGWWVAGFIIIPCYEF